MTGRSQLGYYALAAAGKYPAHVHVGKHLGRSYSKLRCRGGLRGSKQSPLHIFFSVNGKSEPDTGTDSRETEHNPLLETERNVPESGPWQSRSIAAVGAWRGLAGAHCL